MKNFFFSLSAIFSIISILTLSWVKIAFSLKKGNEAAFKAATVVFAPLVLLFFWTPEGVNPPLLFIPILITLLTQTAFFTILRHPDNVPISLSRPKAVLAVFSCFYVGIFIFWAIMRYQCFSDFNAKDFAIYNQTFWNSIHGRWFENSAYGSNFACHNSPFFFLLIPFYYLVPHPMTLIAAKIILLGLSAIPFYLIAKPILKNSAIVPMTITFLMYPYLVSQTLTAPHEMCYAPFFILFTYYFYQKNKFLPFMIFLLIVLSIKEHLVLLAVMFGLYACIRKRSWKWVLVPIITGIIWGIASILIMKHFQQAYNAHIDAAWFIENLKTRFLEQMKVKGFFSAITSALSVSNIGRWYSMKNILVFFFSLGIITPLISFVSYIGLPELALSLLSDRPAMLSPPWHYHIMMSCFLLIGTLEGMKKIARSAWVKILLIDAEKFTLLLGIFILASTLMYSHTWLDLTTYSQDKVYISTAKEAIAAIPRDADVSVPRRLAVQVSQREKYSLIEENRSIGTYVVIDTKTIGDHSFKLTLTREYQTIFNKNGIQIFKKNAI